MGNQIQHTPGYWTIQNVQHRGERLTVELLDGLLPAMTQEQAGAHARANPDRFRVWELPMYFAVFRALEQQQTQPGVSAPVKFIRKSAQYYWLQTLTAIDYMSKGKDVITHGIGTEKPYSQEVDAVGPSGQITQEDSAYLKALVGTGDVENIKRVLKFIYDAPVCAWGIDALEVGRSAVGIHAYYLSCVRNPQYSYPALGVREGALEEQHAQKIGQ